MKLYDSSVWIDFLRETDDTLEQALRAKQVLCHPFVIGEVLLGSVAHRDELEKRMSLLPSVEKASDKEAFLLIRSKHIYGRGIGWVDVHLLASAKLTGVSLETRDKRLKQVAEDLGVA